MATADELTRKSLLRLGFALEYVTLAWNVAGIVLLAAGYHPGHSVLGIIWAAAILAAAIMATLVMNAALGWWWADPAAGYLLVYYALSEGREIAAGSADHGRER